MVMGLMTEGIQRLNLRLLSGHRFAARSVAERLHSLRQQSVLREWTARSLRAHRHGVGLPIAHRAGRDVDGRQLVVEGVPTVSVRIKVAISINL